MGREVKRVTLEFDWPLNEKWPGFVMPDYGHCEDCDGTGSTGASDWLEAIVHLIMIAGRNSVDPPRPNIINPHPYLANLMNRPDRPITKEMAEISTGLAGQEPGFLGHDASDSWAARNKIVAAAGLPETWGRCTTCDGRGHSIEQETQQEAWKETPPPAGDGWQIWETVSEGSPITPVFATPEELAYYCEQAQPWQGDEHMTREEWLRFIHAGWAPSGIGGPGGVVLGTTAVGRGLTDQEASQDPDAYTRGGD